jgi:hypothetical protein
MGKPESLQAKGAVGQITSYSCIWQGIDKHAQSSVRKRW